MIGLQRIEVEGKRFVLLEEGEYERLLREAREGPADDELPQLPCPDKRGRVPALEYARISLARDLIRDRKSVGLSQQQLADLAGIRQETVSRVETGKHSITARTLDRINSVIDRERNRRGRKSRG
jgi:DNA-binding Xre family transcriptional regulator